MMEYDLEELDTCPMCGGDNIPKLIRVFTSEQIGSFYSSCQWCGQLFLNPRMTDDCTNRYYQGDYRNTVSHDTSGIDDDNLIRQGLRASVHIKALNQYVGGFKTMLEIGCSAGYLMAECAMTGAECVGIEPDLRYHAIAPASRFELHADISELEPRPFDLICMSHSLEHFNHPREYMTDLLSRYADEFTCVMVEVPNTEANIASYQIHHPFCFTAFTLNNLFNHLGYKPRLVSYHGLVNLVPQYLLCIYERRK